MPNFLYMASVIDWIKWPFGYILRGSYQLTHSYAIAILIFAIVIRLVLFPLGIKQQKGTVAQAKLRPKEMKIRNKYKGRNDKVTQEKMNTEIMELYRQENYSPFSGCLPLLIQLPVILILFYVVTAPISYIVPSVMQSEVVFVPSRTDGKYNEVDKYVTEKLKPNGVDADAEYIIKADGHIYDRNGTSLPTGSLSTDKINEYRKGAITAAINGWFNNKEEETKKKATTYSELYFVQNFKSSDETEQEKVIQAIPEMNQLSEFNSNLFGFIDLLEQPKFFNWLLLIPLLSGIVSYLSSKVTKKLNPMASQPASDAQNDVAKSTKIMDLMFPLFSVYIAYIVPGSVGLYWMLSNVIMIAQSFLLAKMFPIPTLEELENEMPSDKKSKKKATYVVNGNEVKENNDIPSISKGKLKDSIDGNSDEV